MPIGDDTFAYERDLPHLQKAGKTYFSTFCTMNRRLLCDSDRDIVLSCCVHDHLQTYWLHCVVVMPDHVHMLFTPYDFTLAVIMRRVKGVSARQINKTRDSIGSVWQSESFDHILRSDEDVMKTADYICNNPVRAGLAKTPDEYRWIWRSWVEGNSAQAGLPAPH
jgi:REP-associated tyrosine transposase